MSPRPVDLVVFDMAGTVVDDAGMVEGAMKETVLELDPEVVVDDATLATHRGGAKIELFRAVVPDRADEALANFTRSLRRKASTGAVSEIPGTTPALQRLDDAGCAIAMTTGFDRVLARDLIRGLGWVDLVTITVGGDEVSNGRPAPDLVLEAASRAGIENLARVAVCGDTINDVAAGIASGAGFVVAVATGDHPPTADELPTGVHLVESVADLPELLGV